MTAKFYTGVGSRSTPRMVRDHMMGIALALGYEGYTLRSGGAEGADAAFEYGANLGYFPKQVFRPIGERSAPTDWISHYASSDWAAAAEIAGQTHPAWHRCNQYARDLHTRNVFQVLGHDLNTPSEFLICWTPDGATTARECTMRTGGTGMAIRIADQCDVHVYNMGKRSSLGDLLHDRFNGQLPGIPNIPHPDDVEPVFE